MMLGKKIKQPFPDFWSSEQGCFRNIAASFWGALAATFGNYHIETREQAKSIGPSIHTQVC
jgi:hypothetical protein